MDRQKVANGSAEHMTEIDLGSRASGSTKHVTEKDTNLSTFGSTRNDIDSGTSGSIEKIYENYFSSRVSERRTDTGPSTSGSIEHVTENDLVPSASAGESIQADAGPCTSGSTENINGSNPTASGSGSDAPISVEYANENGPRASGSIGTDTLGSNDGNGSRVSVSTGTGPTGSGSGPGIPISVEYAKENGPRASGSTGTDSFPKTSRSAASGSFGSGLRVSEASPTTSRSVKYANKKGPRASGSTGTDKSPSTSRSTLGSSENISENSLKDSRSTGTGPSTPRSAENGSMASGSTETDNFPSTSRFTEIVNEGDGPRASGSTEPNAFRSIEYVNENTGPQSYGFSEHANENDISPGEGTSGVGMDKLEWADLEEKINRMIEAIDKTEKSEEEYELLQNKIINNVFEKRSLEEMCRSQKYTLQETNKFTEMWDELRGLSWGVLKGKRELTGRRLKNLREEARLQIAEHKENEIDHKYNSLSKNTSKKLSPRKIPPKLNKRTISSNSLKNKNSSQKIDQKTNISRKTYSA